MVRKTGIYIKKDKDRPTETINSTYTMLDQKPIITIFKNTKEMPLPDCNPGGVVSTHHPVLLAPVTPIVLLPDKTSPEQGSVCWTQNKGNGVEPRARVSVLNPEQRSWRWTQSKGQGVEPRTKVMALNPEQGSRCWTPEQGQGFEPQNKGHGVESSPRVSVLNTRTRVIPEDHSRVPWRNWDALMDWVP